MSFTGIGFAFSFTGFTDQSNYNINETLNFTGVADQNLTSNVSVYLINSSGHLFNFTSTVPNSINFTMQLNTTVLSSGDYFVKTNFTLNSTYYESSAIVKISKAQSMVITTDKPAYSPGEIINFTVRATDVNNIGVSGENVTVRLMYTSNDTVLNSKSGLTDSSGEYKSTFTAPQTLGSYRLTVNEWVATRIIDISTFDLVTFTGDSNGNIKSKFSVGDTAFIYMDLFDSNQTRYTGSETISVQVAYPNGTQNQTISYTFSGSRLNTSFVVRDNGIHNVKVTVVSTSKSLTFPLGVGKYELVGWLERNATQTSIFFPNETVNIIVKVFNVSSGEVIKTAALNETFGLNLFTSSFTNISTISNSSAVNPTTGARTFTLSSGPNTIGSYYIRVSLNQTKIDLNMKVIDTIATATPTDQSYSFKNMFVGSKQSIRILTSLSNSTHLINVTNITVISLKSRSGTDLTSTTAFNTSIVNYKDGKAGIVEFSSPPNAGLYFIKTLVNNNYASETQFLIRLFTACAQLDGYKWFISSGEDANLTVRVSEAQDVSIVDSVAGNSTDTTNTVDGNGSFSTIYGMHDCYAAYKTTASGSSTAGNNTANIAVTVKKIINTLSGEDITGKVGNLPSNNTDDNGKVTLRLNKPSGGWDGGNYVVELELRDKNNNTDKGFGSFQVKSLWVNVWPTQVNGRWRNYFSPTENMSFDVNAYNSTGTWYQYGQNDGAGDNCYVTGVFYSGNGIEWFWPPKEVATSKYSWSCTNRSAPAKGRFNLTINHTVAFDTGNYMIRVKVNTTAGVGDVGEGWFGVKAYNVYVRTVSSNYYDSWYRSAVENVTLDIDITYANSTSWGCYWQSCPASERVTENLNVSAKLVKYDGKQVDYPTTKYSALFANNTASITTTNISTSFLNASSPTNASINTTRNVSYVTVSFTTGGDLSLGNTASNVSRTSAGSNTSTTISMLKNATINLAYIQITPFNTSNVTINVSLNDTAAFANFTSNATPFSFNPPLNFSIANNLTSFLSSCTDNAAGNCTVAFNATFNGSGKVQLDAFRINYTLVQNTSSASNSSVLITVPKNSTINSAFISVNVTSGNFTANISLSDYSTSSNLVSIFNISNLNITSNNVSFGTALNSSLSSCTNTNGNCTLRFNITLNSTGTATLSHLLISYNTTQISQNTSFFAINTTTGNANLTLVPGGANNRWESGYYSAAITVDGPQGKETGTYWFEIRSFFANLQPVNASNTKQSASSYSSGQNITINISATNKPSWLSGSSYNVALTNVPVNITAMKLSYWNQANYEMTQIPVIWTPNSTTVANPTINGTTTINITPQSTLSGGIWYNLEAVLTDSSGNNQTGWTYFQIKDFTFVSRTKNWQYEFNNTANISLDVAVCNGETWWCNFGSNSYSGNPVNITVTRLYKSDSWPYTIVNTWTANSSTLNSTNSGQGVVTIYPTSALSGGYYSAELTARYADGSGSTLTSNVWFRVESFKFSANTLKWQYSMSENVTLRINTGAAATLSDATLTCGYWPSQTSHSISGGTLSANSTSLSAGDNLIMLSPSGSNKWAPGYCSGYVTVTSGVESRQAYVSFDMKAFTLEIAPTKTIYLKNESLVFKAGSAAGQYFNISDINITFYNYENNSHRGFRLGQGLSSNTTGQSFKGNGTINVSLTSGNWTFKGWHTVSLVAVDSNNSAITQTTWFQFDIRDLFLAYGHPIAPNSTDHSYYSRYNTTSQTITMAVYAYKYNSASNWWWPYDNASSINVSIASIEKQSCTTYPCTYSTVTGWGADTAITRSGGIGELNITKSGGWSSGLYYVNLVLVDSTTEAVSQNRGLQFWVNS